VGVASLRGRQTSWHIGGRQRRQRSQVPEIKNRNHVIAGILTSRHSSCFKDITVRPKAPRSAVVSCESRKEMPGNQASNLKYRFTSFNLDIQNAASFAAERLCGVQKRYPPVVTVKKTMQQDCSPGCRNGRCRCVRANINHSGHNASVTSCGYTAKLASSKNFYRLCQDGG